ncbi:hypothetical protein HanHA89_Chr15g0611731 [Helianthus annuus]|nr:hypothetical protein HanHA89_Chr15g0611731 [Helianthus annuus]
MKKIAIERMDVIEPRELFDDGGKFFVKVRLCELYFSHVKLTDAIDSIALVDNSRCLPLGPAEYDIDKIFPRRYFGDFLEIVLHHV